MMTKDPRLDNEARYDRMAGSYATTTRLLSLGLISRLRRAAAGALDLPTGATLLEVGCGPATLTPYLRPRVGDSGRIIGVDISSKMIALARRKAERQGWDNVEFERCNAIDYSPPAPVDAVVFCLALSALPDCGRCVENALAVLKPRGQLVVVDSILLPGQPVANFVIRRKASALGGYPDDLPLSLLVDRLEGVQTRRLLGGVYTLVAGRKPA